MGLRPTKGDSPSPLSYISVDFCAHFSVEPQPISANVGRYWRGHKRHGHGRERLPGGSFYDGEWIHGMRHGFGTKVFPGNGKIHGSRYEGEWRRDMRHGIGTERLATGFYTGE